MGDPPPSGALHPRDSPPPPPSPAGCAGHCCPLLGCTRTTRSAHLPHARTLFLFFFSPLIFKSPNHHHHHHYYHYYYYFNLDAVPRVWRCGKLPCCFLTPGSTEPLGLEKISKTTRSNPNPSPAVLPAVLSATSMVLEHPRGSDPPQPPGQLSRLRSTNTPPLCLGRNSSSSSMHGTHEDPLILGTGGLSIAQSPQGGTAVGCPPAPHPPDFHPPNIPPLLLLQRCSQSPADRIS